MVGALDFTALMKEERKRMMLKQKQNQQLSQIIDQTTDTTTTTRQTINTYTSNADGGGNNSPKDNDEIKHQIIHQIKQQIGNIPKHQFSLQKYKLYPSNSSQIVLNDVFYIPNFISHELSNLLVDYISQCFGSEKDYGWINLKHANRNVCAFDETGTQSSSAIYENFPAVMDSIALILVDLGIFEEKPNHLLMNQYSPGEGILPHTDGPRYDPCTATLSLSSSALFHLQPRLSAEEIGSTKENNNFKNKILVHSSSFTEKIWQVLLEPNSLLVFSKDAYTNYLHSIKEVSSEMTSECCVNCEVNRCITRAPTRISLTFRRKKSNETQHASSKQDDKTIALNI